MCGGCFYARYCSDEHQKEDWRRVHKYQCAHIKATLNRNPTFAAWVLGGKNCLSLLAASHWEDAATEAERMMFIAEKNFLGFSESQSKYIDMNITAAALLKYEVYACEIHAKASDLASFVDPIVGCEHNPEHWPDCPDLDLQTVVFWHEAYEALFTAYIHVGMQPESPRRAVEQAVIGRKLHHMWDWRSHVQSLYDFFQHQPCGSKKNKILNMLDIIY